MERPKRDYIIERPNRPENYDFCLSVLGDPEETELNAYVEALEAYCEWADGEIAYISDQLSYEMSYGSGC
jgi:hypothetical protein